MFIDEAVVTLTSGRGGPGCTSFRREKYVPKGGPDGGNGGRGGDAWIVAGSQKNTLVDFRHVHRINAEKGRSGGPANRTGKSARPLEVMVPPGTLVYDQDGGALLADLDNPGARVLVARGGDPGRGNAAFATSTNRAPRRCEPGWPGAMVTVRLELKLLADVGLVGFPSVGKSTFIAAVSACRPEIADYPFTTLVPNLGVVERFSGFPFVIADVPGLIEGAHEGKGLGIQFLKHVQRTSVILHILDCLRDDPLGDWRALRNELKSFDPDVAAKHEIVAINKVDVLGGPEAVADLAEAVRSEGRDCYIISAATGEGVDALLRDLARKLRKQKRE